MKNKWTATRLQSITQGILAGPPTWTATTFTHDSRQTTPGQLYVAIKGETVDGHDYVEQAFQNGAVAALVSHIPPRLPKDSPLLLVPNVENALLQIGHYVRDQLTATVIGITGSSGKTTTKDMLQLCLSQQGKTHANFRSFNSRWGVPLTLAECMGDEKYVVLEMGMSAPGEIAALTHMARPHIALITTINPAHLADLGSTENIACAKAEIFEGVPSEGVALIPGDLPETSLLLEKAKAQKIAHIFLFGEGPQCDLRLMSYTPDGTHAQVKITLQETPYTYTLNLLGKHFAMNSLAVLGAVQGAKANVPQALHTLAQFQGSDRRGQVIHLGHHISLFDESYNANPGSMKAALEAFGSHPHTGHRYLVLGDMRALGANSKKYHEGLKDLVLATQPRGVFTYGPEMKALHDQIKSSVDAHHYEDLEALITDVLDILKEKDAILVKASNAVKLNKVSDALMKKFIR
ncbi:MAG TPA: UDP-N-acetylmuramoylalanyl-D-glutamyl-2, 6-diaminopimelate--D-alanyl-D-alanine ligase [Holosporales bacterium]|nr:UDP-N-acetylmuramoylalanyl-D-glutamyl-2, 6-diaminopimelate--D-alanyl-D-alanine ligase [Holosporales bacterium]